ncbi:DUF2529 domain-containing protein [Robertmurraya andreesenii]|uniref:DUF2529 domain-containing protein n=1 Tax=Anoxybacillus andreesenii TaxID=1325932 RepID=A0ABT9V060_9BACL|nr:DUF2529 domain-containing protein [Robertmurraya andreesenii]MDQ0154332.1 hypothetical protein [Robertmurraya andreesenii]
MLKMFSTQLSGLFKKIQEQEEFSFEDGARLIAQAAVGDGSVYLFGEDEMGAVISEALYSAEPFEKVKRWDGQDESLTSADRVIIFSRYSHDDAAVSAGKWLIEREIPFVSVSTHITTEKDNLVHLADVHIDLHLKRALLPDDEGNRFGYPASMAALFVYYGLKFTLEEIMEDY